MADKVIQMQVRNASNTAWDSLNPKTKASAVLMNSGKSVEESVSTHLADTAPHSGNVTPYSHLNDLTAHGEVLSLYRSGKDSNGVYVTLQWKRADGTLAKMSVLSGGTSPKYTTRTVTYYAADGTTVLTTKTYTETYTGDDLTSEVLQ